MTIQKLGVLGITDDENNLIAVVYHNEKTRAQIFYTTDKCGMENIESLLVSLITK